MKIFKMRNKKTKKIPALFAEAIALLFLGITTSHAGSFGAYMGSMDSKLLGLGEIVGGILELDPVPFVSIQLRGGYASSFDKIDLGTINLDNLPEDSQLFTQQMLAQLDLANQFELEDFCIIPLEIGLIGRMPILGFFSAYIGGGVGYYIVPAFNVVSKDGFSVSENIADISGLWGLIGIEAGLPNLCVFAEMKYTQMVKEDLEIQVEYGGYNGILTADLDLSGMTYLAGIRVKW